MKIQTRLLITIATLIIVTGVSAIIIGRELSKNALEDQISDHLITTAQSRADHIETHISNLKVGIDALAVQVDYYATYFTEKGEIPPEAMYYVFNAGNSNSLEDGQLILIDTAGNLTLGIGEYGFQIGMGLLTGIDLSDLESIQGLVGARSDDQVSEAANLATQLGMPNITQTDLSDWDVFQKASNQTCVMDTRLEEFTQGPILAAATPFHAGKELGGVVAILGGEKILASIASDLTGMGETGEVYVVNAEGYMITPSRFLEDGILSQNIDLQNNVDESWDSTGIISYNNYLGTDVIGVHKYLPETEWTVVAEISSSEAYAPISDLTQTMIYSLGALLFVGMALAFAISRMITSPILKLKKGSIAIMEGNLDYQVGLDRNDELGDLSMVFDAMAAEIKRSQEELQFHAVQLEDLVKQRTSELAKTNETLEGEIKERKNVEEQIRASLEEKEILIKEIHHRVKNNLQIISSLLNLQAVNITDEDMLSMFRDSQHRVRSMALVHEQLYKSKTLASVDFGQYIRNLAGQLTRSHGTRSAGVVVKIDAENIFLGIDSAVPCGLIVNELITNSFRYAFPDDIPSIEENLFNEIHITCQMNASNKYVLTVGDNGVGLPEGLNFRNTESLGMQLVCTLTDQLGGAIEVHQNDGAEFRIEFSEQNIEKEKADEHCANTRC